MLNYQEIIDKVQLENIVNGTDGINIVLDLVWIITNVDDDEGASPLVTVFVWRLRP